jgi:putative DNA primase/helicase
VSDHDEFVALVERVTGRQGRKVGGETVAYCPSHEADGGPHTPSLSIREGDDGRPLVVCRSRGCSWEAICAAIGWSSNGRGRNEPEAVYVYADEHGKPLIEVGRFPGKRFLQRRAGAPDWKGGIGKTRRVLYRLPEVIAGIAAGAVVYVPEGEKDVDRLRKLGVVATCNAMGAGKWTDGYAAPFAGASVVVIADRDEPGIAHARAVAASLERAGATVELRQAAIDKPGADVSDHLDAGLGLDDLVPLVANPYLEDAVPEVRDDRPLDDDGNALRLADRYADDLRFVIGEGWHAWDGTRWRHDDDGAVVRAAREIAEQSREQASRARGERGEKDERAKALVQHAKRTGSARGIAAMVDLARSDLRFVLRPERIDADPYLLNAANGTIDLLTGELRPHRREDLLTRRVAAAYDPDADAPAWVTFIERVLPDPALRAYAQTMAGAAAVGTNADELLHVLHGPGANGKSKFVRTVASALGDYGATAGASLLLAGQRHSAGQPELVRLRGARLLVAGETDEGSRLNVALVKALTGGDTIAARLLYENAVVEFVPVFSPWLVTNHRPSIPEQSEAIWRRVRLVPFPVTIPRRERDPSLQGRLLAELPGVLAWIVDGARRYITAGLEPPAAVEAATDDYREEESAVGRFITERCQVDPAYWVQAGDLYAAWKGWCVANGEDSGTQTAFGRRLSELRDEAGEQRFPPDSVRAFRIRRGLRLLDPNRPGGELA